MRGPLDEVEPSTLPIYEEGEREFTLEVSNVCLRTAARIIYTFRAVPISNGWESSVHTR